MSSSPFGTAYAASNGKQAGDLAKLAASLIKVIQLEEAPARWVAGADAVEAISRKGQTLIDEASALLDLSTGLDVDQTTRTDSSSKQ